MTQKTMKKEKNREIGGEKEFHAYLVIKLGLSSKLTSEVLGRIGCWPANSFGHFSHVDNDGFNAVTYLGK